MRMSIFTTSSHVFFFLMFFFQAEDGIRDLVRSRGLGDVYKRQPHVRLGNVKAFTVYALMVSNTWQDVFSDVDGLDPVSYTHLTLPTSDLV